MHTNLSCIVFFLVLFIFGQSFNANASECRTTPVTVNVSSSATMYYRVTAKVLTDMITRRLKKEWEEAATKKFGPDFKHPRVGKCTCKTKNIAVRPRERVTIACQLTARACAIAYQNRERGKCEYVH